MGTLSTHKVVRYAALPALCTVPYRSRGRAAKHPFQHPKSYISKSCLQTTPSNIQSHLHQIYPLSSAIHGVIFGCKSKHTDMGPWGGWCQGTQDHALLSNQTARVAGARFPPQPAPQLFPAAGSLCLLDKAALLLLPSLVTIQRAYKAEQNSDNW